ncbi:MAG: SOS response-associated peptidase [Clostridia bacterium]|nr:SOS response-associated peptidase [Clostridia bacterium]
MCGRYHFDDGRDSVEIREIVEEVNRRSPGTPVKTEGEILPTDRVPVLARGRDLAPGYFAMQWGYTLPGGRRLINARSETAMDKPLFREGMLLRRCAVPACHYCEWQRRGRERTKYIIRSEDGNVFYMAGLYRLEQGKPVFVILTRAPAGQIAFIHDRMPLILSRDVLSQWIDPARAPEPILKSALLSVVCRRADENVQLAMEV